MYWPGSKEEQRIYIIMRTTTFSQKILVLTLPLFYPHRIGGEKAQQFQNWIFY